VDAVDIFPCHSRDAAHALHQVEHDAFARQDNACIMADDGDGLPLLHAHTIEYLGVMDHLEPAGVVLVEAGKNL
jgi:hypothetical protein